MKMVYNVLVVDDSIFMRKIVSDLIESDPNFRVIDTARNGSEAVKKTLLYNPSIITMDIEMPVMNGLEALYRIMKENPRPVIMLSAYSQNEADLTFKAIELGAVDFVPKPNGEISLDLKTIREELFSKLYSALKAKLLKKPNTLSVPIKSPKSSKNQLKDRIIKKIIVIAASTGGPRALIDIISKLPTTINCPILIVQHMQEGFTNSFAKRLDSLSEFAVSEAIDKEIIQNRHIYIAKGNYHLTIEKNGDTQIPVYQIKLDQRPAKLGVRPNADYLFESAARVFKEKVLGIVLTGMGRDGAEGSKIIHDFGGKILTESEKSSVVYGMPRKAAEYAEEQIDLSNFPEKILNYYYLI